MQQKLVKKAYFVAIAASVIIYVLGLGTGLYIQKTATTKTEELIETLQRSVESAQLEYVYISTLGERVNCDSISTLVDETTQDVRNIGIKLTELENKGEGGVDFNNLKKDYTLLSTRGWILNTYVQEKCDKNVTTLLYFYSVPCEECEQQGFVLDELVESDFKNQVLVFVLDANVDEPIVSTFKKTYNIQTTPSIVVGNATYTGLQSRDDLRRIIAQELTS